MEGCSWGQSASSCSQLLLLRIIHEHRESKVSSSTKNYITSQTRVDRVWLETFTKIRMASAFISNSLSLEPVGGAVPTILGHSASGMYGLLRYFVYSFIIIYF